MTIRYVLNPFTGELDTVDDSGLSSVIDAACLATDSVGDCVKITGVKSGSLYQVEKIDIDSDTVPAIGIIESKSTSTQCVVRVLGILEGVYTGLVAGTSYLVDTDSQLTPTIADPPSGVRYIQVMGVAVSDDEFLVMPSFSRYKKVP